MNRIVSGLMKTGLILSLCVFSALPAEIHGTAAETKAAATTKPAAAPTQPAATTKPTAAPTQPAATTKPAAAPTQPAATTKPAAAPTQPAATTKPAAAPTQPAATTKPAAATTQPEAASEEKKSPEDTIAEAKARLERISADDTTIRIMLDPGHGGNDSGASGYGKSEKKVVLKIGKALVEELMKYDNVSVGLTRVSDRYIGLHGRTRAARKKKADIMISLHCDAFDEGCLYDNGSSVIVARKGTYKTEMVTEENHLARSILAELEGLGLTSQGLVRRASAEGDRYEDGSLADYYGIIRDGMLYNFPVILIEHCFMDSKKDHEIALASDEKIQKLAAADARGIAKYLGLKKKDTGKVEEANVRKGKALRCTGRADTYFSLQKKVYFINMKRELEARIASAEAEIAKTKEAKKTAAKDSEKQEGKGSVDGDERAAGNEQVMTSAIRSTARQDKATEGLALAFGLALCAYYGVITLSEMNQKRHG